MAVALVLVGLAALLGLFWIYFSWNFNYWQKRGVPSVNSLSLLGVKNFWMMLDPVYQKFRDRRFAGMFLVRRPVMIVMDPDLSRLILTKNFSSFQSRGLSIEKGHDVSTILFFLDGPRWKNLRAKLSPTFSSGKLKLMLPLMSDVSQQLCDFLEEKAERREEVDFQEVLLRYVIDIIGSVAFGFECKTLTSDNEFHHMTMVFKQRNILFIMRLFLANLHPIFVKLFPLRWMFNHPFEFFQSIMKTTLEHRETHQIQRHDLVDLMLHIRATDRTQLDRTNHIEFTDGVMTTQALFFFIAGLDGAVSVVGCALHELALQPDLQERAAAEVRQCVAKHNGMTYEALKDMAYLDMIIMESLRKWGPSGVIMREATEDFKIPDSDVVIEKNLSVWIPTWQMQHDPKFFPDPERFDPERFTEAEKAKRHPSLFLPFGEGPRYCIAMRFAMLKMKMALATVLSKYQVAVGDKTQLNIRLDPKSFSPWPMDGLWLRVETRPSDTPSSAPLHPSADVSRKNAPTSTGAA